MTAEIAPVSATRPPGGRHWDDLALALAPDRALLGPTAAAYLVWVLDAHDAQLRRDGRRPGDAVERTHVRQVLEYVAAGGRASDARRGHEDVPRSPRVPASRPMTDPVTTPQAAELLGRSRRQASRLARGGAFQSARKLAAGYAIERAEVLAYAKHANQETP